MHRSILLLIAMLSLSLAACTGSHHASAGATPMITVLDAQASQLQNDFDRAKGSVRLLLLVDPTCAICLRGLADVNHALLARTNDPRLVTFVVYEPVIGATLDDVLPAAELLHNEHVHNYWDANSRMGRLVTQSLQLAHNGKPVFAWDVWMIYGTTASLSSTAVPEPALFMHQLPALRGQPGHPFLDSVAFAAKAHELLANMPALPSAKPEHP